MAIRHSDYTQRVTALAHSEMTHHLSCVSDCHCPHTYSLGMTHHPSCILRCCCPHNPSKCSTGFEMIQVPNSTLPSLAVLAETYIFGLRCKPWSLFLYVQRVSWVYPEPCSPDFWERKMLPNDLMISFEKSYFRDTNSLPPLKARSYSEQQIMAPRTGEESFFF